MDLQQKLNAFALWTIAILSSLYLVGYKFGGNQHKVELATCQQELATLQKQADNNQMQNRVIDIVEQYLKVLPVKPD